MDLIDTSTLSLSIGGISCIVAILITKYFLESRNKDLAEEQKIEYNKIWMYSIAAGIGVGVVALLVYKQFLMYRANSEIMTENFYDH